MKKRLIFQKESTVYYNGKEEGRPYPFAQLMPKFLLSHTCGSTKRIGNLNSAFETADSPKPPPPQKRESTRKKSVYLPPILQNCVYEYR